MVLFALVTAVLNVIYCSFNQNNLGMNIALGTYSIVMAILSLRKDTNE